MHKSKKNNRNEHSYIRHDSVFAGNSHIFVFYAAHSAAEEVLYLALVYLFFAKPHPLGYSCSCLISVMEGFTGRSGDF